MIDFFLGKKHLELVGAACAAVLVALPFFKSALGGVRKQIGRMSLYAKILLLFCIVDSIIVCGTKTDVPSVTDWGNGRDATLVATALRLARYWGNGRLARYWGTPISLAAVPVMLTPEDIARGYRVESVVTNETPLAAMPSNDDEYAKWHLRGGYETCVIVELRNYAYPNQKPGTRNQKL